MNMPNTSPILLGAGSGADGVGGCHERVGPEVNIEHRSLCAFAKHAFPLSEQVVDQEFTIYYVIFLDVLDGIQPVAFKVDKLIFIGC